MIVLDVNPASSDIITSGSSVQLIAGFAGVGHSPTLNLDWALDVPQLIFTGSATYTDRATQYLIAENNTAYNNVFSCSAGTWAAWSMFVVFQLQQVPTLEASIFSVNQVEKTTYPGVGSSTDTNPLLFIYASSNHFAIATYSDGTAASTGSLVGTVDTNPHLIEVVADGSGNINMWFDGSPFSMGDRRPKTPGSLTIGAAWYPNPHFVMEQLNGQVARVLLYDENLSTAKRLKVRNILKAQYGL